MERVKAPATAPVRVARPGRASDITAADLDRFLDFVSELDAEAARCIDLGPPRELAIQIQLMRSHLHGRMETPSSLIAASGLPRGTAHRLIMDMIDRGLVQRRPRTASGKTYSLHPDDTLVAGWFDYARRCRALLETAFSADGETSFYFGGSYLARSTIRPLSVLKPRIALRDNLRILLHADPAFLAMQKVKRQLEQHFGTRLEVRALSIDRLREEILRNAKAPHSAFDIVTCDVCWMPELIAEGALRPLGAEAVPRADRQDFHPPALATAEEDGSLYGLPVQTTPELLVYRKDILDRHNLLPPRTLDDLLEVARTLHQPDAGISGLCWNGARGTPVATTFMLLMADFGQPVLDRAGARPRPMLDSPAALCAAEFLMEMLQVSPDTVLQMSWFERAQCYATGRAAMAYCYTQMMPIFENDPAMAAHGRTGYTLHPSAPGVPQMAPLGGWILSVPANLSEARAAEAERAVKSLASPEAIKAYIEGGSLVTSRFSVCNDPGIAHRQPIIPVVDQFVRAGQVQTWPRPAVPEFSEIVRILGTEIHDMLLRNKPIRSVLRDAQARLERALA